MRDSAADDYSHSSAAVTGAGPAFPWTAEWCAEAARAPPLDASSVYAMLAKPTRQWQNFEETSWQRQDSDDVHQEISDILAAVMAVSDSDSDGADSDDDGHSNAADQIPPRHSNSNSGGPSAVQSRYFSSSLLGLPATTNPFDTDFNMRTMDRLFNASFCLFIRSESNVMAIARRLMALCRQYSAQQVAAALRWIVDGWSLESVAKLVKIVSREWSPALGGSVINLLTSGWHVIDLKQAASGDGDNDHDNADDDDDGVDEATARSRRMRKLTGVFYSQEEHEAFVHLASDQTGRSWPGLSRAGKNAQMKLVAIMAAGEVPSTVAGFIKSLTATENWTPTQVTELVSFLDAVLEWDEKYFLEFTRSYLSLVDKDGSANQAAIAETESTVAVQKHPTGKLSFEYLSALYRTGLALTTYQMALEDFKAALVTRSLSVATDNSTDDNDNDNADVNTATVRPDTDQAADKETNVDEPTCNESRLYDIVDTAGPSSPGEHCTAQKSRERDDDTLNYCDTPASSPASKL